MMRVLKAASTFIENISVFYNSCQRLFEFPLADVRRVSGGGRGDEMEMKPFADALPPSADTAISLSRQQPFAVRFTR